MRRGLLLAGGLAVLLVALLVLARPTGSGRPYDPRSTEADGTRALVLLLEEYGMRVTISQTPPSEGRGRVLVLDDRLRADQRDALLAWVERGGRLVVADADSALHGGAGLDGGADDAFGTLDRGRCTIDGLDGLRTIDVGQGLRFPIGPDEAACFGDERNAFVVEQRQGAGTVTALGSADPFTNELLAEADDAALALDLLAGDPASVVVLEGTLAGGGDEDLLDLVPLRVWHSLVLLGAAFVLLAWALGRRLGHPVEEVLPVALPGNELVVARADLVRRARRPGRAAVALQGDLHRELCRALAVAPTAALGELDAAAAERLGTPPGEVSAVLTLPVTDEAALDDVARRVDAVRARLDALVAR
jgi:hypothetical protein